MALFDVYLARTYRVQMEAEDEHTAERLAEEFIGPVQDKSTAEERAEQRFQIREIETVDNHAFDSIPLEEG